MALVSPQKAEKRKRRKIAQTEYELSLNKDKRQAFILKTLTGGMDQAVTTLKIHKSHGDDDYVARIMLGLWEKDAAFLLYDYRGLEGIPLDKAIGVDVMYFLEELKKIVEEHQENLSITLHYHHKGSALPHQIWVQNKKN